MRTLSDLEEVMSVQNIVLIRDREHLVESQHNEGSKLSACVCVIKPNQPINVASNSFG